MSAGCGKKMSGIVVQTGTLYVWGKGDHEKPKFDDHIEYSSPFPMIEDKLIMHVSFGMSHVMALDKKGRLYGWGEGQYGCLGFGDNRKRLSIQSITAFDDKRVIDVSCGDRFTVVIAEVYDKSDLVEIGDGAIKQIVLPRQNESEMIKSVR